MRRTLLAVLLLAFPAAARAQTPSVGWAQQTFDRDGDPLLTVGYTTQSQPTGTWHICRPAEPCVDGGSHTLELSPGKQPAGTTFTFTSDTDGTELTSKVWGGRVTNMTAPVITGAGVVGTPVDVNPGTWSGGWPDDFEVMQVQVCESAAFANVGSCETIAAPVNGFPTPVTLEARDIGKYVYAVDAHWSVGTMIFAIGYSSARGVAPWQAGPTVTFGGSGGFFSAPLTVTAAPTPAPTPTPTPPPPPPSDTDLAAILGTTVGGAL